MSAEERLKTLDKSVDDLVKALKDGATATEKRLSEIDQDISDIASIQENIRTLLNGGTDLESVGVLEHLRNHTRFLEELSKGSAQSENSITALRISIASIEKRFIDEVNIVRGEIPSKEEFKQLRSETRDNTSKLVTVIAYGSAAIFFLQGIMWVFGYLKAK